MRNLQNNIFKIPEGRVYGELSDNVDYYLRNNLMAKFLEARFGRRLILDEIQERTSTR